MMRFEPPMTSGHLVVVGSGPAGLAAVRAYRDEGGERPVTMITADEYPPYARPPLTKDYLRGKSTVDDLWLTEPGWFEMNDVALLLQTVVTDVDLTTRRVRLSEGPDLGYADLVLATGSNPMHLPVPGGDEPGLVYIRDRRSGDRLRDLAARSSGRVAVIGSGFIGCEAAASLAVCGVDVVLITDEQVPHASRLGDEAGRQVRNWLTEATVELRVGAPLAQIRSMRSGWRLGIEGGETVDVDHVVCGSGARPNLDLAESAGLRIESGGVLADAAMLSSEPGIRVAGDIACARNNAAGRHLRVEHWGDAESQGRIAGSAVAGRRSEWDEPPGFWSTIGEHTIKYSAWGDGFDGWQFVGHPESWSVWYRSGQELCGVLTHEDDDAYARGQDLLARRAPFAEAVHALA